MYSEYKIDIADYYWILFNFSPSWVSIEYNISFNVILKII